MGKKGGGRNAFVKSSAMNREDAIGPADVAKGEPEAFKANAEAAASDATSSPVTGHSTQSSAAQPAAPSAAAALHHDESETQGQMSQRHKRELKSHKEAVKKLGKKRKDEVDKLDKEIADRHAQEVADLQRRQSSTEASNGPEAIVMQLADSLYDTKLSAGAEKAAPQMSKAQKRRQARAKEEAEREERIAGELAQMGDSERVIEEKSLAEVLQPLGLAIRDIPADGHCLYRAVGDQLDEPSNGAERTDVFWVIRARAAAYMRAHPDQFIPFMPEGSYNQGDDVGRKFLEQATDNEGKEGEARFEEHCDEVEKSAAWGSQLELEALSKAYQRHITVYSVGMPPVEMGQEFKGSQEDLRLCYLRHAFGLGEHYNSVKAIADTEGDDLSGDL